MLIAPRVLMAAVATLGLCAVLAPARALGAAEPSVQGASAARLIEKLGLRIAPQPVRERRGWRPPRIVLVSQQLHELLPALQQGAPRAKLIQAPSPTPPELPTGD